MVLNMQLVEKLLALEPAEMFAVIANAADRRLAADDGTLGGGVRRQIGSIAIEASNTCFDLGGSAEMIENHDAILTC